MQNCQNQLFTTVCYAIKQKQSYLNMDEDSQDKKRIRLERKIKKWTDMEINKLLDYLIKYPEFESPTAQRYYTKCIECTGINATWNLLRWKVRHLRINYKKAKEYRESTIMVADSDEDIASVEAKVLKICPQFVKMEKIFGGNLVDDSTFSTTVNADDTNVKTEFECVLINAKDSKKAKRASNSISQQEATTTTTTKKPALNTLSALLVDSQKERIGLLKEKLEFEKEKFYNELNIKKEEIKLREKELEVKLLTLEHEERIKKMELDKEENIAKYELDLKYNNTKII